MLEVFCPSPVTIEPVWLDLKNILCHLTHPPSTITKLKAVVLDAWEQLSLEQIDGHIQRMGDHVEAVLEAKGGHTKF